MRKPRPSEADTRGDRDDKQQDPDGGPHDPRDYHISAKLSLSARVAIGWVQQERRLVSQSVAWVFDRPRNPLKTSMPVGISETTIIARITTEKLCWT
jgi:hypothetical protein